MSNSGGEQAQQGWVHRAGLPVWDWQPEGNSVSIHGAESTPVQPRETSLANLHDY